MSMVLVYSGWITVWDFFQSGFMASVSMGMVLLEQSKGL